MKRLRTVSLLAVAAMAAVALTAPASASATNWLKNHVSIEANEQFELDGVVGFDPGWGGAVLCQASAQAEVFAGTDEGEIDPLQVGTGGDDCTSWGAFEECEVDSAEGLGPSQMQATAEDKIEISGFSYEIHFAKSESCGYTRLVAEEGELTATPDNAEAMSSLSVTGTTKIFLESVQSGWGFTYEPSFDLNVSPAEVYGLG